MEPENNTIINYIDNNFSPTKEDITNIAKHYEKVWNILWPSTLFQSWSYPRNTSIRPINDLDIIKVLSYGKSKEDAEKILLDIHQQLLSAYAKIEIWYNHLKLQKSSIWIYFAEDEDKFSIDIVPAIETNKVDVIYWTTIYNVPEIQKINKFRRNKLYSDLNYKWDNWIYSAPKAYKEHSIRLDDLSQDKFRYFVRFIKQWKRNCKKEYDWFCLKSFHIEQICWILVNEDRSLSLYWLLFKFFDKIEKRFQEGKKIQDLAYEGGFEDRYIDEYVEDPEKNTPEFREYLRKEVIRVKSLLGQFSVGMSQSDIDQILDKVLKKAPVDKPTVVSNIPNWPWLWK